MPADVFYLDTLLIEAGEIDSTVLPRYRYVYNLIVGN